MKPNPAALQESDGDYFDEAELEWKTQVFDLTKSVNRLTEEHTAKNSTVELLQSMMTELNTSVQAMMKSIGKMPIHTNTSPSERYRNTSQVNHSFSEQDGSNPLGYRAEGLNLANRESVLKKVEMPCCDGTGVSDWIGDIEYFYALGRYSDEAKMGLVPLCLQGALKKWFGWVRRRGGFRSWTDFKQRLMLRFSESIDEEPETRLFALKQVGSVSEYVTEFETLSAQVPGLSYHLLEHIFYNGLSTDMKEVIRMKDPQGLQNYISAVLRMETSVFCKVVSNATKTSSNNQRRHNAGDRYTTVATKWHVNDKNKGDVVQNKENIQPKFQRPRQKHTDAELAAMRRDKICFKCKAPWSRAHADVCPNKELRILSLLNGWEVEVLDQEEEALFCEDLQQEQELMTLSYNSFLGISSPKTTKLRGRINQKEVLVMLDSGASHNFISPAVVKKLHLEISAACSLDVQLGNGLSVKALGVCRAVNFVLSDTVFTSDFISLELGNVDVILGVQWLETLGRCEVDWRSQEITFTYQGERVTLLGDLELHNNKLSLKSLSPRRSSSLTRREVQLSTTAVTSVVPDIVEELPKVLDRFGDIFAMPVRLPPIRGQEHAIVLVPGVSAV